MGEDTRRRGRFGLVISETMTPQDDEGMDPLDDSDEAAPASGAPAPTPASVPPTLAEAFTTLCAAMAPHMQDNVPALTHLYEIQGWYANGNIGPAWLHVVALLQGVLGTPLRG
jgi:hypothetical protein